MGAARPSAGELERLSGTPQRLTFIKITMKTRKTPDAQRIRAVLASVCLVLTACASRGPVDPNAKEDIQVAVGNIKMPSGVDLSRLRFVELARRPKVYVEVIGRGAAGNEKVLFNADAARSLDLTDAQIARRFRDTIIATRRFDTYTTNQTVTAEESDYVINLMFTGSTQELVPIEGGRQVVRTRVRVSAQLINRFTDSASDAGYRFDKAIDVVGETGAVSGDRVVLLAGESAGQSAVQKRMAVDYERALQRAFDEVVDRISQISRPMAKVVGVDGNSVGLVGGVRHGFQGNDEMVVFRAKLIRVDGQDVPSLIRPVAVVRCDGVGSIQSQCDVVRQRSGDAPKEGDFAILTDEAASRTRER